MKECGRGGVRGPGESVWVTAFGESASNDCLLQLLYAVGLSLSSRVGYEHFIQPKS